MIGFETTKAEKIRAKDDIVMWGSLDILHVTKVRQEQETYHISGTMHHTKGEMTVKRYKGGIVERLIIFTK